MGLMAVLTMSMKSSNGKFACIILAAGKSERFNANKLFATLTKGPLLFMVVDSILSFKLLGKLVIVAAKGDFDRIQKRYGRNQEVNVVVGGINRTESTLRGLHVVAQGGYEYVYVHDGSRRLFTRNDFIRLKRELLSKNLDGVVQYVKIYDSLMSFDGSIENNNSYLDKTRVVQLKTPHVYKVGSILKCLTQYKPQVRRELENVEIMSLYGKEIGFIDGSIANIKITYKSDLRVIKKLL